MQTSSKTKIAHMSDIHVWCDPPQEATIMPTWSDFKRLSGYLNLKMTRGPNAFSATIWQHSLQECQKNCQHLIISGDVTNISMQHEFKMARQIVNDYFLKPIIAANNSSSINVWEHLTVVPGNHDAYCPDAVTNDYFGAQFGDTHTYAATHKIEKHDDRFPSIKLVPNSSVMIISVNTAIPTAMFVAGGIIDRKQMDKAVKLVEQVPNNDQYYKIVVIHHPPVSRLYVEVANSVGGLMASDRVLFAEYCDKMGAHLALYGHTHVPHAERLNNKCKTLSVDCGSSTYTTSNANCSARYNVYEIEGTTLKSIEARIWNGTKQAFDSKLIDIPK